MTTLPLFPADSSNHDDKPLPLIVASRWNFPLAHVETEGGMMYAVQDWMRGLTGEQDTRYVLAKFKKTEIGKQVLTSSQRLKYKTSDGKTQQRDYINDKGLYLIAQYMRVTQDRPMLDEIRRFLASAGAFVDEVRREPEKLLESVQNPDKLLDAFIAYYRKQGKDDRWIQTRIETKIKRNHFTAALNEFVIEAMTPRRFATATDDVYQGLWRRSAATLKEQLRVPKNGSLRDHQPILALHYQGIVEEVCAQKLEQRDEVTWDEARAIIQTIAAIIGRQADETSQLLQQDIATGSPLLAPPTAPS
jgi:hypothetical protein